MYRIKEGAFLGPAVPCMATMGVNTHAINIGSHEVTTFDIGGSEKLRCIWRHYYPEVDAVVFVVDAADREGIAQAKEWLHAMMRDMRQPVKTAQGWQTSIASMLLVLANKQDLPGAMGVEVRGRWRRQEGWGGGEREVEETGAMGWR